MLTTITRARIRSVRCALAGLLYLLRTQHNARLHALATTLVIAVGSACRLAPTEWCWLLIAVAAVWTTEALNTALELLCDATTPTHHPLIGHAKDLAAAAVLITALTSLAIGLLILTPHLLPPHH